MSVDVFVFPLCLLEFVSSMYAGVAPPKSLALGVFIMDGRLAGPL